MRPRGDPFTGWRWRVRVSYGMRTKRRPERNSGSETREFDQRVNDALTDLSAYALTLDVECLRLDDRLLELAQTESLAAERRALLRERNEIAEELTALRRTIRAFQQQFSQPKAVPSHASPGTAL